MENEIWKDVKGYEGLYQVSNLGRVKSLTRVLKNRWGYYNSKERILKPWLNGAGYVFVKLTKKQEEKTIQLHRLVVKSFLGESDLVVNHKDFNKANNNINNLHYCTQSENVRHYEKSQKRYSKHIGVTYDKNRNKWVAKFKKNKKTIFLGRFETEKQAYERTLIYEKTKRLSNTNI
jgi:hypothetical protein